MFSAGCHSLQWNLGCGSCAEAKAVEGQSHEQVELRAEPFTTPPPVSSVHYVRVQEDTAEFKNISQEFYSTIRRGSSTIIEVLKILNYDLWEAYCRKKAQMLRKLGSEAELRECDLYHGTPPTCIEGIAENGFDWRLNGTHVGAMFGKGSYFAREAGYADRYSCRVPKDCSEGIMFVAKVLLGQMTPGKPEYRRPPPKDPSRPMVNFYDSCVDSPFQPQIFVIFENDQSYPAYLIKYSRFSNKGSSST